MPHCFHEKPGSIRKFKLGGITYFGVQCEDCLRIVGPKLSPTELEGPEGKIHPKDVSWAEKKKPFQGKGNVKKRTLQAYYRSSIWKRKRDQVLERDQWICFGCGEIADQVDHITYPEELGTETLDTLRASCGDCNQEARQQRIGGNA